jgi:uncharacterized protein YjbI with pentapeptide repeats
VNLTKQALTDTDLQEADLEGANLEDVDLEKANIEGANLANANLRNAKVTDEQLMEVRALEGATMPNGQRYKEKGKVVFAMLRFLMRTDSVLHKISSVFRRIWPGRR